MLARRAFLGAVLAADRDAFGAGGMTIAGVRAGGMLDRAGVRAGDRVVGIAGLPVRDTCGLSVALRRAGASATAPIVYARGDEMIERFVDVEPHPREPGVDYGELDVGAATLRTLAIATRSPPRALVAVVQGIACESIEVATRSDAPLAALIDGWAHAGFDSLRADKRGIGDSDGRCDELDFATELDDVRIVLDHAAAIAARRGVPLFVFGHSVGGVMAAELAGRTDTIAGIVVYGTPVTRWFDCLVDSVSRQLALRGAAADEIERATRDLEQRARGGGLNGRSAAYHAQLHDLDLEAMWRRVDVPVLVVRGEHDWVVRADDQARIATLVPRGADIVDLPGVDHLFGRHVDRAASLRDYGDGRSDPELGRITAAWIDRICSMP